MLFRVAGLDIKHDVSTLFCLTWEATDNDEFCLVLVPRSPVDLRFIHLTRKSSGFAPPPPALPLSRGRWAPCLCR